MTRAFSTSLLLSALLVGCRNQDTDPAPPLSVGPQILFGDLHVHSTNSVDVYVMKVPLLGGKGAVGPEVHCDFARYCSRLDFWAITDHQEGAPPSAWTESREAVQTCNDLHGGAGANPDMVTFAGFEWQQSAQVPADDWGHKNVIFPGVADDELPARAIASSGQVTGVSAGDVEMAANFAALADPDNQSVYDNLLDYAIAGLDAPPCDPSVGAGDRREDCVEFAEDPATLYDKLDAWGFDALVIPHGLTWGAHHPPHFDWRHQLNARQHDPRYQTLVEMYSGHGSMEEYRTWAQALEHPDGTLSCPEATDAHLPCCWRAGELVRERADACVSDPDGDSCQEEVEVARQAFLDAGREGFLTVPGAEPADWLDCGECRDCFQPAEGHRPMGTTQAGLAMTAFDDDGAPLRYQFGFIGSTDTHAVGPGTGYKEFREMSDIFGPADPAYDGLVDLLARQLFPDWIRQNSYYYAGGLAAVHAPSRSRDAIWQGLRNREVYATTGERILLWFDLLDPPGDPVHMGGSATVAETPRFEVRVAGSYKQAPGCPAEVKRAAPAGLVDGGCFGECYNPTDERYLIDRVEVVRIRPQIRADEALVDLIDDPFLTLDCPPDPEGCVVTFEDPDFVAAGRPALYYVRAVQEPTLQLNATNLRCEEDGDGNCLESELCLGGHQGEGDACLAADEERAWASPIYLSPP